ncbi:Uncharacterised protein [Burkholderia pseudomallei]|nr:Uncharacterised protein [Burkholderia pseudomallei]
MQYVDQFMFAYQHQVKWTLGWQTAKVFVKLGLDIEVDAILIGVRRPESSARHAVCIEPEDGIWKQDMFDGLLDAVESTISDHPAQNLFYSDRRSMEEKPERIRCDSVRRAVHSKLGSMDANRGVDSFCGQAVLVDDYYVVPVVQIPAAVLKRFPPLRLPTSDDSRKPVGYPSLVHACLFTLLSEASDELRKREPGRGITGEWRRPEEMAWLAADRFMLTPAYAVMKQYVPGNLFERFNAISSLMYEGAKGVGQLVLANPDNPRIEYALRFAQPVPFYEHRWARKVLQLASTDTALIADSERIYGLGRLTDGNGDELDVYVVDFVDHSHWLMSCSGQPLIRSVQGRPRLPEEAIEKGRFIDNFARLFPASSGTAREQIWSLFCTASNRKRGSMIVVAADAQKEAQRLAQQGTLIEPVALTTELFDRVSGIDGTILVDSEGICYAIGVILDGLITDDCTPSRGSRYNSGIRYVSASRNRRLAIVISDDATVDVFPLLRPRVSRRRVEVEVSALEQASVDSYHKHRNWLDEHRFYLDRSQCSRANAALARIEELERGRVSIRVQIAQFVPDPSLDDSYFLEEDE